MHEETDSIRELKQDLKARLAAEADCLASAANEPLFFNGVELADEDATLLEYNVVPDDCPGGPVVHMGTCPCSFPSCSSRADQSLRQEHVTGDTTVAQLKGRITSEVGIPYLCMKLFAGTKELRDFNGSIGCRFGFGPNRFRALGLWRRGRIRCRSSAMVLQGTPPCRCRPGLGVGMDCGVALFPLFRPLYAGPAA
ncbi:unnamed protein product [Effrenium voratum]|nr:unnamed protein product [Effrenium voratum]